MHARTDVDTKHTSCICHKRRRMHARTDVDTKHTSCIHVHRLARKHTSADTHIPKRARPRTPSHTRPPTPTHTPTHTHTHTHTKRARAHTHPPTLPSTPECRRRVKVCTCAVALRGVGGCGGSGVGGGRSGCLRYIRGPPPGSQPRGKVGQLATPVRV